MAGREALLRSCRVCCSRMFGGAQRAPPPSLPPASLASGALHSRSSWKPTTGSSRAGLPSWVTPVRALHNTALLQDVGPAPPLPPSSSHCILNFYHLVDIARPFEVLKKHRTYLEGREVRGRIYISHQGINAQCGGVTADAVAYAEWLAQTQPLFKGLKYKLYPADTHAFPRLRLKYRPNLISLAGGMASHPVTNPQARATPLDPTQWEAMLNKGVSAGSDGLGSTPVVLDVRNSYEWDAGHFVGAQRPVEDEFRETPTSATSNSVPPLLEGVAPDTPIMMYCTGGIRCDVYSTHLRAQGYENLYTLEGGIQSYIDSGKGKMWKGSLYVFDGRMAVPGNPEEGEGGQLDCVAPCRVCGGKAVLPHMNCANIDCNRLFVACPTCKTGLRGCCCEACMSAPRLLRPLKESGMYGGWEEYAGPDAAAATASMTSGRTSRRIARRRERAASERQRLRVKHEQKAERRQLAAAVMASRDEASPTASREDPAWQRLREARLKLLGHRQRKEGQEPGAEAVACES